MSKIELRGYQKAAVQAVVEELKNPCRKSFLVVEPCGAGKSYEIAGLMHALSESHENLRTIIITPSAELVMQDYRAITNIIGKDDVGIDCRMEGYQTTHKRITVTNINTIYRDTYLFNKVDLIVIDEAHQIRQDDEEASSMYRNVEAYFRDLNPDLCVVGFTATPHRLSEGIIYGEDKFFSHIVHETKFSTLVIGGFLCPLYCHLPKFKTDFSLAKTNFDGEFVSDTWKLIDTDKAVKFMVARAARKKKVLIFAANIEQANIIKTKIEELTGEYVGFVTGDTDKGKRARELDRFCSLDSEDKIKYFVNVQVLKQGFDNPAIDMVVLFRPTKSATLYVQMCCRGSRKSPSTRKTKCEILDFGGNIERHGFIDEVVYHTTKQKISENNFEYKECPKCGALCSPSAEYCAECNFMFAHLKRERDTTVAITLNTKFNILSDKCKLYKYAVDEFDLDGNLVATYPSIPEAAAQSGEQVENIMFALDLIKQYPGVEYPINKWLFHVENMPATIKMEVGA